MKDKYYTLVGSRKTPGNIKKLLMSVATKLISEGYTGRSGGAEGADEALEEAVAGFSSDPRFIGLAQEIYLPWEGFNGKYQNISQGYYTIPNPHNNREAEQLAEDFHPMWHYLKSGGRKLHTRNVYQVLGQDLATPSDFLICYARPNITHPTLVVGGTATAVAIAAEEYIPIINLWHKYHIKNMQEYINSDKTILEFM